MGRLPCVGVLRPRQVAKKSRGSRPVFLLSHSPSKVRNKNLDGVRESSTRSTGILHIARLVRIPVPLPLRFFLLGRSRKVDSFPMSICFGGRSRGRCRPGTRRHLTRQSLPAL